MQKINYQAITGSKAYQGLVVMDFSEKKGLRWKFVKILIALGFLPAIFIFILLFVIIFSLSPILSSVIFLIGIGYLGYLSHIKGGQQRKKINEMFQTFAKDNGWTVNEPSPEIPLFRNMEYESEQSIVSGQIDGLRFWLYWCRAPQFQFNSDGSSSKNDVVLLSVELPLVLPTLFLASVPKLFKTFIDDIAINEFGLVPLSLEGTFDNSVSAYMSKDDQVNALSYLTPDVMDVVERHVDCYIIYSGNFVSVSTDPVIDYRTVKPLFEDIQILIKEVKEKQNIA